MNLQLNVLVTGQQLLALTWLHWLHIVSVGALLYFLIKGFQLLKPVTDKYYPPLEWALVLALAAYLAGLVTNSPATKTSVQDLIEPWVFLVLAVGAGYSVHKWPDICEDSLEQKEKPDLASWRLGPNGGALLVATVFSMGILYMGIKDVRQGQNQAIAADSTAARQTQAMRKENRELRQTNDMLTEKMNDLTALIGEVLIIGQANGASVQVGREQGRERLQLIKQLSNQIKQLQRTSNRRTIPTPNPIQSKPFNSQSTSQAPEPEPDWRTWPDTIPTIALFPQ